MKLSRHKTGFFRPGSSNFASIQTLLGDFINDRTSPSLLEMFHKNKSKKLSQTSLNNEEPFERIIQNNNDLREILSSPEIYKNSVCIIEPADHVGKNLIGENVRASSNIASLCQ